MRVPGVKLDLTMPIIGAHDGLTQPVSSFRPYAPSRSDGAILHAG